LIAKWASARTTGAMSRSWRTVAMVTGFIVWRGHNYLDRNGGGIACQSLRKG
jgi:hypothetical protein